MAKRRGEANAELREANAQRPTSNAECRSQRGDAQSERRNTVLPFGIGRSAFGVRRLLHGIPISSSSSSRTSPSFFPRVLSFVLNAAEPVEQREANAQRPTSNAECRSQRVMARRNVETRFCHSGLGFSVRRSAFASPHSRSHPAPPARPLPASSRALAVRLRLD